MITMQEVLAYMELLETRRGSHCRMLFMINMQEVLAYVELLETRRQYLCNLTPMWSAAPLLLCATSLDTNKWACKRRKERETEMGNKQLVSLHSVPCNSVVVLTPIKEGPPALSKSLLTPKKEGPPILNKSSIQPGSSPCCCVSQFGYKQACLTARRPSFTTFCLALGTSTKNTKDTSTWNTKQDTFLYLLSCTLGTNTENIYMNKKNTN